MKFRLVFSIWLLCLACLSWARVPADTVPSRKLAQRHHSQPTERHHAHPADRHTAHAADKHKAHSTERHAVHPTDRHHKAQRGG